jgi:hypothetical protein
MSGLHPDYGLTDELRLAAVRDAERLGIERAAELHRVSRPSIYKWRKIFAAQIEEGRE